MSTEDKIKLMAEVKNNILSYLRGQQKILIEALKVYDNDQIKDQDAEIRRMRESEAIKLRDRVSELNRHISAIELM